MNAGRLGQGASRPTRLRLRHDTLADSVVLLLAATVVQRLVGFGRSVLFCRWLEPAELGQWDMAFSFLMLAAPLAVFGLPGSFGRYLEHYRQRSQLRTFLLRTTVFTAVLGLSAALVVALGGRGFSRLMFASPDRTSVVRWIALCLGIVILQHFLESLFTALRLYRLVSVMQFTQSLGFAVIGVTLLTAWRLSAESVIVAYGAACFVSSAAAILYVWPRFRWPAEPEPLVPHRTFWPKLMTFAIWVWVANLATNLFEVADRYMLVHFGSMDTESALAEVGHYHSSRIVPLLLVSVSGLLGAMITPHLSRDWEAGQRSNVADRLNLAIKLVALGMFGAGVGLLLLAPLLFGTVLRGKYSGGLTVLPETATYCIWFGITMVAQNYLWCAERARWCSVALLLGLLVNVVLNLVLVPRWGLTGVVLATMTANGVALAVTLELNRRAGMRIDRGTYLACGAPLALGLGVVPASLVLGAVLAVTLLTGRILTTPEKQNLLALAAQYAQRMKQVFPTGTGPAVR